MTLAASAKVPSPPPLQPDGEHGFFERGRVQHRLSNDMEVALAHLEHVQVIRLAANAKAVEQFGSAGAAPSRELATISLGDASPEFGDAEPQKSQARTFLQLH